MIEKRAATLNGLIEKMLIPIIQSSLPLKKIIVSFKSKYSKLNYNEFLGTSLIMLIITVKCYKP